MQQQVVREFVHEEVLEYYDWLHSLNIKIFNKIINSEWNGVIQDLLKGKRIIEEERTGIFRRTPGAVKCSSGVKFGSGGV